MLRAAKRDDRGWKRLIIVRQSIIGLGVHSESLSACHGSGSTYSAAVSSTCIVTIQVLRATIVIHVLVQSYWNLAKLETLKFDMTQRQSNSNVRMCLACPSHQ